ncbi:MAG TPA: hypothetical protein VJW75_03535 [Candidatus Eisenbacteria bacterium]|nr:hypothetical protein [Candidatus Eisenbacteria bacterium]
MSGEPRLPEDLRAEFATLSASAVGGPDCPPPEAIWDAVTGAASSAAASAVVDHTSRCFACAEAWRLARELHGPARAEPGSMSGSEPGSAQGSTGRAPAIRDPAIRNWTALAAAVVVLSAGVGILMLRRQTPTVVMRAGEEVTIASLTPESVPLPKQACVLKWSEPAGGARYTVRVGSEDLSPVAHAENLDRNEFTIPPADLEKLPPGSVIVWRVEAALPDGRRLASPGFRNRLE